MPVIAHRKTPSLPNYHSPNRSTSRSRSRSRFRSHSCSRSRSNSSTSSRSSHSHRSDLSKQLEYRGRSPLRKQPKSRGHSHSHSRKQFKSRSRLRSPHHSPNNLFFSRPLQYSPNRPSTSNASKATFKATHTQHSKLNSRVEQAIKPERLSNNDVIYVGNDDAFEQENNVLNPYNYTEEQVDAMIAAKQLIIVRPDPLTYTSPAWAAGLRKVCFPNGDEVTNIYRCMWCGHHWNCILEKGTGNMKKHVFAHFNSDMKITRQQLAQALASATEIGDKYGVVNKDTFMNFLPMKKKNERSIQWSMDFFKDLPKHVASYRGKTTEQNVRVLVAPDQNVQKRIAEFQMQRDIQPNDKILHNKANDKNSNNLNKYKHKKIEERDIIKSKKSHYVENSRVNMAEVEMVHVKAAKFKYRAPSIRMSPDEFIDENTSEQQIMQQVTLKSAQKRRSNHQDDRQSKRSKEESQLQQFQRSTTSSSSICYSNATSTVTSEAYENLLLTHSINYSPTTNETEEASEEMIENSDELFSTKIVPFESESSKKKDNSHDDLLSNKQSSIQKSNHGIVGYKPTRTHKIKRAKKKTNDREDAPLNKTKKTRDQDDGSVDNSTPTHQIHPEGLEQKNDNQEDAPGKRQKKTTNDDEDDLNKRYIRPRRNNVKY